MSTRFVRIALYILIALGTFMLALYVAPGVASREESTVQVPLTLTARLTVGHINEDRSIVEGDTALKMLLDATAEHDLDVRTKDYPGMGKLVEKIGMDENGKDGKYWLYYVNGAFAPVGADSYVVKPGDIIEWNFEVPQQY